MTNVIESKHIVLGVCGGIAAYKSVELLRLLVKKGAEVRVLMTANAAQFIGPMTFEALSGRKVVRSLFEPTDDASIQHIQWAQEADAVVIAPATANMIGKLANGIADDALSTFILAVTCPVMICPSMNTNMYASSAVQRNIEILKNRDYRVPDPAAGELACGTCGPGRLPEPPALLDMLEGLLSTKDFRGRNVVVTAGPTREAIDPVRFISNPSSGKMGYAIARAAEMRGAQVILITGPTALTPPPNTMVIRVGTAKEMLSAVLDYTAHADVIIKCAAVSDYRPVMAAEQKIKKSESTLTLTLERTQDILKVVAESKKGQIVVGFAAETRQLDEFATTKLNAKKLDMIVGNLIGSHDAGFGSDTNRVCLYFADGTREAIDTMPKEDLAHVILDRISRLPVR
jgi:phosphopantothenoylcysteine decarboxylase / phosphopantothenate---cysteine ligase